MAMKIPTVEGPSVQQQGIPDAYEQAPRALGQAGMVRAQQTADAANLAGKYAEALQRERDEMDQVREDDALNKLIAAQIDLTFDKDKGFTTQRGDAVMKRQSGKPLSDEYTERLDEVRRKLADELGNERQKRRFGMKANNVVTTFSGQVRKYEGEQADAYVASVREGTIANRQNEAARYWNDLGKIDEAIVSIESSVADLGRRFQGKSAEWIQARALQETSRAALGAVQGAMESNNFMAADLLLKRYHDKMTEADVLRARGLVDKQLDAGIANQVATAAVRAVQPTLQPTDMDRVIGITIQSESGGRRYGADGKLLTSPKGARGEMQVLDSTNDAPGLGVKPAKDNSPEERARVGRDYMGALVKRYEGDLGKAWAAYNAGFAKVDKAVADSESPDMAKRGKFGNWIGLMPAETQAYVAKNTKAYADGGGRPQMASLQEIHNAVRQRIGDSNPHRLTLAIQESTRQYEEILKANKQQEEQSTAEAQRWLESNGGRFSSLPASLRANIPPGQFDNLRAFAEKVSRGDDITNPATYQMLTNPAVLGSLSDEQFYILTTRELNKADRQHFVNERQKLLTGTSTNKPADLNSSAISSVMTQRLRELGIDPTPKDGSTEAQRVGAIRRVVDESILSAQQAAGKKFTDAEVTQHIDRMFAQTDVASGWFSDSSKPMLTMKAGDIKSSLRERIEADFKRAGIENPTEGQILGAYWMAKRAAESKKITPLSAVKPQAAPMQKAQ